MENTNEYATVFYKYVSLLYYVESLWPFRFKSYVKSCTEQHGFKCFVFFFLFTLTLIMVTLNDILVPSESVAVIFNDKD